MESLSGSRVYRNITGEEEEEEEEHEQELKRVVVVRAGPSQEEGGWGVPKLGRGPGAAEAAGGVQETI